MRVSRVNPFAIVAGLAALLLAAGCSSSSKPTPKETATKQWNAARAGVLAGLAKDQYQAGNFDKCRQTLTEALRLTPENRAAARAVGQAVHRAGPTRGGRAGAEGRPAVRPQRRRGELPQRHRLPAVAEAARTPWSSTRRRPRSPRRSWPTWLAAGGDARGAGPRPPTRWPCSRRKVDYFEHSGAIRDAVGQLLMQIGRPGEAVAAMLRQASDPVARTTRPSASGSPWPSTANKDYRDAGRRADRVVQTKPFAKRADLFTAAGRVPVPDRPLPRGPLQLRDRHPTRRELRPRLARARPGGAGRGGLQAGRVVAGQVAASSTPARRKRTCCSATSAYGRTQFARGARPPSRRPAPWTPATR